MANDNEMPESDAAATPEAIAELRRQVAALQAVVDNMTVGIAILDSDLAFSWVNPTMAALFEKEPEHMVGKNVFEIWPYAEEPLYLLVLKGEAFDFPELRRPYPTGDRWFDTHYRPYRDESGAVVGVVVIASEITERKLLELELQQQTAQLRAVVDNVPSALAIFDKEMTVRWENDLQAAIFGLPADQMIGKVIYDLQDFSEERREIHRRAMRGESLDFLDHKVEFPEGERHFEAFYRPYRDRNGEIIGIIVVGNDITKRRQAEIALDQRSEELARSNAELEQFAYVASHDLQEPLRMVSSFVEILAADHKGKLGEEADKHIGFILDGSSRMKALIDDLLAYSRVGTGEVTKSPVDCEEVLVHVTQDLGAVIEESAAKIIHDPLPVVPGDPTQLGQLFQNLVSNALKFRGETPPHIYISVEERAGEWLFQVQDDGIGIEPRHFERIFQMFQRVHHRSEYPGTGIGLAMCKKIVDNHGGRIWIESEIGKGTTFFFCLPKTENDVPEVAESRPVF